MAQNGPRLGPGGKATTTTPTPSKIPSRRNSVNSLATTTGSDTTSGPHSPGRLGIGGGYVLSARTCLDVLHHLDDTMLERELAILESLDSSVREKRVKTTRSTANTTNKAALDKKRGLLKTYLQKTLANEFDNINDKYNSLVESVCRSTEEANQKLEVATQQLQSLIEQNAAQNVPRTAPSEDAVTVDNNHPQQSLELEDPVRVSDVSFAEFDLDDVKRNFTCGQKLPGNRSCSYYGKVGYSYGNIKHDPCPYPAAGENLVLDKIFDEISKTDPAFNRDNFSCLATYYENGNSSISMHHDDERVIAPGSSIYTVSFGAQRTAKFVNVVGPLQTKHVPLQHGSLNIMTRSSQSTWKHGVIPEPTIVTGRISLTFRHMIEQCEPQTPELQPQNDPIPRIEQPAKRDTRVLFLTDSIHASTPTHLFDSIPHLVCIKKKEFQLANLNKYRDEFAYTDIVVISMGVNDLSRYRHTSASLMSSIAPLLRQYSNDFPQCKFMFNTVLLSRDHQWLNAEIDMFNNSMYELSKKVDNLCFFDSDLFVMKTMNDFPDITPYATGPRGGLSESNMRNEQSNNGIHLSHRLKRIVSSELVRAVGLLSRARGPRFRQCMWLRNVALRYS